MQSDRFVNFILCLLGPLKDEGDLFKTGIVIIVHNSPKLNFSPL